MYLKLFSKFTPSIRIAVWFCLSGVFTCAASQNGIYFIDMTQEQRSVGSAHGSVMAGDIRDRLKGWNALLEEYVGKSGTALLATLRHETDWLRQIKVQTPHLLDEIRDMAEAAGVNYSDLLTYNLAEEIMTWHGKGYEACSNIAGYTGEGTSIAYNLDIPLFLHGMGKPYAMRLKRDKWLFGFPGIIATTVVSRQFAITTNSLPMLNHAKDGLPLPFALRLMAREPDLITLEQKIKSLHLGVAQNLMILNASNIVNVEKSSGETAISPANARLLVHTNFPLFSEDFRPGQMPLPKCERFASLSQVSLKDVSKAVLKQAIFEVREEDTFFTLQANYCPQSRLPDISLYLPNSDSTISINRNACH